MALLSPQGVSAPHKQVPGVVVASEGCPRSCHTVKFLENTQGQSPSFQFVLHKGGKNEPVRALDGEEIRTYSLGRD